MGNLTRESFLLEIINYYNINRLSIDSSGGRYYMEKDGEVYKCAISFKMNDERAKQLEDTYQEVGEGEVIKKEIFNKVDDPIQRLGKRFLYWVQELHDTKSFWDENGLTKEGIKYTKEICYHFNIDFNNLGLN